LSIFKNIFINKALVKKGKFQINCLYNREDIHSLNIILQTSSLLASSWLTCQKLSQENKSKDHTILVEYYDNEAKKFKNNLEDLHNLFGLPLPSDKEKVKKFFKKLAYKSDEINKTEKNLQKFNKVLESRNISPLST
jgi:hypothetical protein